MRRYDGHWVAHQQLRWRADAAPIATVRPGESLQVEVPDSSTGQLSASSRREDLQQLDLDRVDAAVGPFEVEGAAPGDSLVVHVEHLAPGNWGWSGVFREFGLLRGRFEDDLTLWARRGDAMEAVSGFLRPVRIPLRPMLGWIGVAPAEGELGMIPPRVHGGNLDNRFHGEGAELALPVQRPGAMLLVGDPHAAQGDGEVCGTGIEVPATVVLRVEVRKGEHLSMPRSVGPPPPAPAGRCWVSEGVASDPREAALRATEDMIERLVAVGLTAPEAYLLLSVAGELRISEAVDEPNWVVSMVFSEELAREAAGTAPRPSR